MLRVVGLLVGGVTVIADLAIAVVAGVVVSALVFAWEHAKQISVNVQSNADGRKTYELKGTVFFASVAAFNQLFTPAEDPEDVIIDFRNARVADHSALAAIDSLAIRYKAVGKTLHLKHLSADCLELLEQAKSMIEVNVLEDPRYHIADNKLG